MDAIGCPALESRNQADVLLDGHVGEESNILKDVPRASSEPDAVPFARVAACDRYTPALWQQQSVDEFENRALAGAATPDERDDVAWLDRKRHAGEYRRPAGVAESDIVERHTGAGDHCQILLVFPYLLEGRLDVGLHACWRWQRFSDGLVGIGHTTDGPVAGYTVAKYVQQCRLQ